MTPMRIAAFVMAGGEGTRLRPLTENLPKPALPFAGRCRIIDFTLANLRNSGVDPIVVLLQYKPEALVEHLRRHWPGVLPLLPEHAYAGTADAVRQGLRCLDRINIDLIAVFAADHVYRMDVRQMADFHLRQRADVTIAARPMPVDQASDFGVLVTDDNGRVTGFQEKPAQPARSPHDPREALVSMGNYIFNAEVLRTALRDDHAGAEDDFGRHVLPRLVRERRVYAYDFRRNCVPGAGRTEEPAYWRDVGTVSAYRAAQIDVQGQRPRFALDNPCWPLASTLAAHTQVNPTTEGALG